MKLVEERGKIAVLDCSKKNPTKKDMIQVLLVSANSYRRNVPHKLEGNAHPNPNPSPDGNR
jgi:hypothetical protein